ncbi:MAG: hypothetical protein P4M02_03765, partial [Clostridia bacterium]|nr:hypothetical protein [Clostridia bacterium]
MGKCTYCGRAVETPFAAKAEGDSDILSCCSSECLEKAQRFYRFTKKGMAGFIVGMLLSIILIMAGALNEAYTGSLRLLEILMPAGFMLLGATILFFPFATPQTFELMGIKKTVLVTRGIGA